MENNDQEKGGLFQKGGKGGPGRPPGSLNVKKVLRAAEVLSDAKRHPITELIKLADECGDKPKERDFRRDIWFRILTYIEGQQTEPTKFAPETPEESVESAAAILDALKKLSEPLEPKPVTPPGKANGPA